MSVDLLLTQENFVLDMLAAIRDTADRHSLPLKASHKQLVGLIAQMVTVPVSQVEDPLTKEANALLND